MKQFKKRCGKILRVTVAAGLLAFTLVIGAAAATPENMAASVQNMAAGAMVLSADSNVVTDKVNIMGDLLSSIVTAVGSMVVLFGIIMLGKSFFNHDPGSRPQAVEAIIGGLVFALAPLIVKLLV